jgi:hypothetical protein
MPAHPAARGAPFAATDPAALAEIARWFADADRVFRAFASADAGASAVRCWPHHFDIATLVSVGAAGTDRASARSIGVGLSPGDGSYAEPYFYVTPWPYPPVNATLPHLAGGGRWHSLGWTGAVLTGTNLVASGPAQRARTLEFVAAATSACRLLFDVD